MAVDLNKLGNEYKKELLRYLTSYFTSWTHDDTTSPHSMECGEGGEQAKITAF